MKPKYHSFFKLSPVAIAGIAILLVGQAARATSLYWDTNGTTAGSGPAAGTWGASNFWNTDPLGAAAGAFQIPTTIADDLFFSAGTTGTAGTVTVDTTQAANSITFDDAVAITVSGGTGITLGSTTGAGISRTVNTASTISTPITLGELGARTAYNFTNTGTGLLTIGAVTGTGTSSATTQTITVGSSTSGVERHHCRRCRRGKSGAYR
jgi:fibronectin-binding autotransporter adhesin